MASFLRLTGATRTAFLVFFGSHVPITILLDGQVVLPRRLYPEAILRLSEWYTTTFRDELMTPPHELFLRSFVACELLFQLPFFVVAFAMLWRNGGGGRRRAPSVANDGGRPDGGGGSGWFRTACLVYGSHTATTLVPILASIWARKGASTSDKALLTAFYAPYLIFPLWLVVVAAVSEDVFEDDDDVAEAKPRDSSVRAKSS